MYRYVQLDRARPQPGVLEPQVLPQKHIHCVQGNIPFATISSRFLHDLVGQSGVEHGL